MDIFKMMPRQFFNLLSGKNQAIYVNCLLEVFKAYEQGSILGLDKEIARQRIIDYLEMNPLEDEFEDEELEEGEEPRSLSNRERANQILRRFEQTEWIDVDVNNDYDEIINFRDYAITIIDALKIIASDSAYGDESEGHEFRGYVYTVYTLLANDQGEYGMVLDQVYKNTSAFIREIRKLDSRLKYYIKQIVENSEIKDLINLLVNYKVELVDQAYRRLKTSDNINKYRMEIVKKLEEYQASPVIMEVIAKEYMIKYNDTHEMAIMKANKRIDDVIDIYNSLSYIIDEIDNKNKVYVNTTIAKIKYLLSDDEDVITKLNKILRYTATEIKTAHTKRALENIRPLFTLANYSQVNNNSLYTPRGFYKHVEVQYLSETESIEDEMLKAEFYKEFERNYSEEVIQRYLKSYLNGHGEVRASDILKKDLDEDAIMKILYVLVYAGEEMDYQIKPLDEKISNEKFELTDFQIIRGYNS